MEVAYELLISLFNAITDFFVIATIILFLHCFYDTGFRWHKKKAFIIALFILLDYCLIPFIEKFSYNHILALIYLIVQILSTLLLLPLIVTYDYAGRRFKAALKFLSTHLVVFFCSITITDIGATYIFPDNYWLTDTSYLQYSILSTILYILVFAPVFFYLYFRIYKKNILLHRLRRSWIFVLLYIATCLAIEAVVLTSKTSRLAYIIMGSFFILGAILIPFFFYYLQISKHFQKQVHNQESYMQAELASFRQYKLAQEETKRFRHDVKNNLLCLKNMLDSGNTDDASAYLSNLVEVTESLSEKYVTGDEILDSILATKDSIMSTQGITFQLDGVLAGGLKWKPVDVCSVFANALDNAIEACMQLPKESRHITLKIKTTPQFWFVRIENPVKADFNTDLLFRKQGGYTSKLDTSRHGIGTYSIKHTAEVYGGIVKAECKNNLFSLEIMIPQ